MSKTLRPSADAFRKLGWLPASNAVYHGFMKDLVARTCNQTYSNQVDLLPAIKDFKRFIETDPTVFQEFVRMFEGLDEEPHQPKDYNELLNMLDDIFRKAPYYGDLGPPMYMIMARLMNTQGGFSAFTKENLNRHFKKLFSTWATFLDSKHSRYVLVDGKYDETHYGWFTPEAKTALMAEFDEGRTFEDVFICDKDAEYHGYASYEDFFNRKFRDISRDRPVHGGVHNTVVVGAPCEAALYNYQENVKSFDELFIKDEAYSLIHLLNNDPYYEQFEGGKIVQGFLNTTGYHRWHSPVNGTIMKIVDVPGTYFAQAPSTLGSVIPDAESKELPPYLHSLRYFSNVAARQIIFIQADNVDIGLLFFISIGMTEISTCQATVYEGQHVDRGEELGMFHFGGSSFALGFRKGAQVEVDGKFKDPSKNVPIKINELIAAVPV